MTKKPGDVSFGLLFSNMTLPIIKQELDFIPQIRRSFASNLSGLFERAFKISVLHPPITTAAETFNKVLTLPKRNREDRKA